MQAADFLFTDVLIKIPENKQSDKEWALNDSSSKAHSPTTQISLTTAEITDHAFHGVCLCVCVVG